MQNEQSYDNNSIANRTIYQPQIYVHISINQKVLNATI